LDGSSGKIILGGTGQAGVFKLKNNDGNSTILLNGQEGDIFLGIRNEKISEVFQKIESKIQGLESKIGGLQSKIQGLESKISGLESRMADCEHEIGNLWSGNHKIEMRISFLEDDCCKK
jgi:peptidoglycan hydrolase CwlO-like protein